MTTDTAPLFAPRVLMVAATGAPGTSNIIRTLGLTEPVPIEATELQYESEDMQPGSVDGFTVTALGTRFTVTTPLAGSGTAGTAPGTDPMWLACGMAKTTQTGVSVTYAPVALNGTTALGTCEMRLNHNGQDHQATKCRGSFTLSGTSGALAQIAWTMLGLYQQPTNDPLTVPTGGFVITNQPQARPVDSANTATVTIGTVQFTMESFTLNINNTFTLLSKAGSAPVVRITDRRVEASIQVLRKPLSGTGSFDPYAAYTSGTLYPVQIVHGPAGNRVTLDVPKVQIGQPTPGDANGIATETLPLFVRHDRGLPNELTVKVD